jgi:hypothetical protein
MSFGGPSKNYHEGLNRICNQAKQFNIFDDIFSYTEKDLMDDLEFWNKHSDFILNNTRGYGYWLWKPYLIKKTLDKINDGDTLLYADCGCELNINGKPKIYDFINTVKMKKIIATSATSSDYDYTKMDLIKYLHMEDNIELLKKPHIQATVLLLVKTSEIIELVNEWYNIGSSDYHFINDSPSINNNFKNFIEHRHDQSIFSLLVKKNNLINYDMDPTNFISSKNGMNYPIWTSRNRCGISLIQNV